jgi:GTP 3',8-cyclase
MPEKQLFMPHNELLNYSEIALLADRFITHGIRKIRLTGGEPLVRKDIEVLISALGKYVHNGRIDELTLTTNGSRLAEHAVTLAQAGVKRINVSLDSLDHDRFSRITRGGKLDQVLLGIKTATNNGIKVKINMVALKGQNETDLIHISEMCAAEGYDLALIETMPLGSEMNNRGDDYIKLDDFIAPLRLKNKFHQISYATSGPARYWQVEPLGIRLGLITPMSHNFCDDCNRLRLTTDGKIYMCLGSDMHVDLRAAIRDEGLPAVDRLLQKALRLKPERHDFESQMVASEKRLSRHMNVTGG